MGSMPQPAITAGHAAGTEDAAGATYCPGTADSVDTAEAEGTHGKSPARLFHLVRRLRSRQPHALAVACAFAAVLLLPPALADPPGRVGRLSALEGEATLQVPEGETFRAEVNLPITSGFLLQTAAGARAEVRIGSVVARIDGDTALRFARVDDTLVAMVLEGGTVALRLRARDTVPEVIVQTPAGQLGFGDVGRYRVDVARPPGSTVVYAERGLARLTATDLVIDVRGGRAVEIGSTAARFVTPLGDAFDAWTQARDRRDDTLAEGHVSPEMTGYEDLAAYGDWRATADYGVVWIPRAVPAGWSPYGYGRWQWIGPWGWTWIDATPWGFAPFHYGRWCWLDGTWAWAPGPWVARPVYAPALVGWIGRPGWSIAYGGIAAAGWVPLAPREQFVPWYRASPRHVQNVNVVQATTINIFKGGLPAMPPPRAGGTHDGDAIGGFTLANARVPRGVLVAPAAALERGQPIGGSPLAVSTAQLAGAAPIAPIAPVTSRWTGPHSAWGRTTYAPPPPTLRPGLAQGPAAPLTTHGADQGAPLVRQHSAMPTASRFGNTPHGFAGSAPRIAPPPRASDLPAGPMFAPPTIAATPPTVLSPMRSYASPPVVSPHATYGATATQPALPAAMRIPLPDSPPVLPPPPAHSGAPNGPPGMIGGLHARHGAYGGFPGHAAPLQGARAPAGGQRAGGGHR
jgi:hypothetical protein